MWALSWRRLVQIHRNRNTGSSIYMNVSCVQINVLHPKDIWTSLFFQAMQVDDFLLGEILLCSFFAISMRLLGVPASNSWLTLCWLENLIPHVLLRTTFSKNVPTSSPHDLLETGASRILILDPKCPEDSHISAGPLEELVHTIANGEQQWGSCVGCAAERGVSKCIEMAVAL